MPPFTHTITRDIPALLYAKRKNVPFILTYHFFDGPETGGNVMRNTGVSVYNKFFINRVLESSEVIIPPPNHLPKNLHF